MRPLVHLWQRFSRRERLLLGAAGAFLLVAAVRFGVLDPYRAYVQRLEERLERTADRVRHMRERKDRAPHLVRHLEELRRQFTTLQTRFIPEATSSLAAARLQERIQTLAAQSGLELATTRVMKEQTIGEFRKTLVQVSLSGPLSAVAAFLSGIEYNNDWLLSVSSLEIRSPSSSRTRRSRRRQSASAPQARNILTITLTVGGVMQQAETS